MFALQAATSPRGGGLEDLGGHDESAVQLFSFKDLFSPKEDTLTSSASGDDIKDANAVQDGLEVGHREEAAQLRAAIDSSDTRVIYMLLGGNNAPVQAAFHEAYGEAVADYVMRAMTDKHWVHVLAFVRYGEASPASKVKAVTHDIVGTNEDALYHFLETAAPEELFEIANDPTIRRHITRETSGSDQRRCLNALEPYVTSGQLDATAKAELFAAVAESQAQLGTQVDTLITRLEARNNWVNDDEEGMLADVADWVKGRGAGFPDLDLATREPKEIMPAIDWLERQLNARQFAQAINTLRTGGQRGLTDKIEEAGENTTLWWWKNTDEADIYAAISAASPQERQAILDDPAQLEQVMALLDDGKEQERVKALLAGQAVRDSAAAYDDLLAELDSWLNVSDRNVFAALDRMSPADLVRIRGDDALRGRIEAGISDVARLHEILGYVGVAPVEGTSNQAGLSEEVRDELREEEEQAGADLAKSNQRVIALVEEALDHIDDNEDKVYKSVIDWQDAGGQMDVAEDAALLARAHEALKHLADERRRYEIYSALTGSRRLTWQDRLENSVARVGTDDAGLEATIEELPDDVLVREWSNLDDYKALAEAAGSEADVEALSDFVVDIDTHIWAMIKKDRRGGTVDLVGQLRAKLVEALRKPDIAAIARVEFHYVPSEELLARLQWAQAQAFAEKDRGEGWNQVSMMLMDPLSSSGPTTEREFGEYRGAMEEVVAAEEGSQEHSDALDHAEEQRREYIESHEAYAAAKESAASIAGAIVGVIASTVMTIATAGAAGPAAAALMSSLCGAVFTELTEAAIQGNDYDPEKGAQDLSVALVSGLLNMGLGPVAKGLSSGLGSTGAVSGFHKALEDKFGKAFATWAAREGSAALESAVVSFPTTYAADLIRTEGLLRQEMLGTKGALESTVRKHATGMVTRAIASQVPDRAAQLNELKAEGLWDEYTDALVKKKLVDIAIVTAVNRLAAGEPMTAKDWVTLVCKVAATRTGAELDAQAAAEDASRSLAFFNGASAEELKAVKGIGDGISGRIIEARESAGGFANLQDVYDVPYFVEDVLFPASVEIRSDFDNKRKAAQSGG